MSSPAEPDPPGESPVTFPATLRVESDAAGTRLDAFLARYLADYSRAALQRAINAGQVTVDGQRAKASLKVTAGQQVTVASVETARPGPEPEATPLDVLYEDDWLAVVNKPPGMIVHPAKGHWNGTLASALAHHFGQMSEVGGPTRPGIVHRLDRDTSGVIVVARHDRAHQALADQFKARTVQKEYLAVVRGRPERDADVVDRPIGVHPHHREKMAIRDNHPTSREAVTKFEVQERFDRFALLRVLPKTGRTHQIRVHLASIGLPILCDKLYGGSSVVRASELIPSANLSSAEDDPLLRRQALHAWRLSFDHPASGESQTFEAPLAEDISAVLACLRAGVL